MRCKQIKKNGEQCKNHSAYGCRTCKYHGARKIKYGKEAPNYIHGEYTQESLEESRAFRQRLRLLRDQGYAVGLFKQKMRGRKS
jgi:hypothetical protein